MISPIRIRAALVLVWIALFLSASKSGLLAAIVCGGLATFFAPTSRRRILAALVLPVACLSFLALFQFALSGYVRSYLGFDETVLYRPDDRNLIMGRVVAAFIIPRMIGSHPILGIGIGNYSLMRNDPDYLKGLPSVNDWDLPGLGLISDAAELGVPLTVFLIILLLRPFRRARKKKAPGAFIAAAAFQPIALLFGVNLNFFYPWLMTAFLLASLEREPAARPLPELPD